MLLSLPAIAWQHKVAPVHAGKHWQLSSWQQKHGGSCHNCTPWTAYPDYPDFSVPFVIVQVCHGLFNKPRSLAVCWFCSNLRSFPSRPWPTEITTEHPCCCCCLACSESNCKPHTSMQVQKPAFRDTSCVRSAAGELSQLSVYVICYSLIPEGALCRRTQLNNALCTSIVRLRLLFAAAAA
jgi:hypothetical protein